LEVGIITAIFVLAVMLLGSSNLIKTVEMFNFFKKSIDKTKNEKQFFSLCFADSIQYALSNLEILNNYNNTKRSLFKSYYGLKISKEELIKSFYFLQDVIIFCKEQPIYQNEELASNIKSMYLKVNLFFLEVPEEQIPEEQMQNFAFGRKFKLQENLGPKELQDLTLVDWRNREQWEYWEKRYGNNELGLYCKRRT
jgi:hypothetical protein